MSKISKKLTTNARILKDVLTHYSSTFNAFKELINNSLQAHARNIYLEFGRRYGLTLKQAFNYLKRYKGIEFIEQHYDYVHTQSFQSMIADIAEYCHRKGGQLV